MSAPGRSQALIPKPFKGEGSPGRYVDAMVCAVPNANRAACVEYARGLAPLFKQHGALAVVDCWGDDVPDGKLTSFPLAAKREPHEAVVLSWVLWPSREVRETAWKTLMDDPRMKPERNPMPFDGERMIYGGFQTILET
jgi:uncharacterized protein YbaA (DUF1428 family)